MNNRMYTYTRKKREYAYIYILAKNWTNWTHPPHKPSNGAGLRALLARARNRDYNNREHA